MLKKIAAFFFENPLVKALGLAFLGLLGNVLSGVYVFEVTKPGADGRQLIDWRASPDSPAFWGLVAVLVVMGLYGWGMARFERRARKAMTDADIRGKVLGELLDPLLAAVKKQIEEGRVTTLDEAMAMFELDKEKRR